MSVKSLKVSYGKYVSFHRLPLLCMLLIQIYKIIKFFANKNVNIIVERTAVFLST